MLMRSIKWSSLKAWGMRLMKTKGRRRAIVAVARKLAVVLHRMWVDGTEFRLGSSRADDGMDEAENVCCAPSATNSEALQTLIPCMRAAAPLARSHPDCEEKRDRVIDQADNNHKPASPLHPIREAHIVLPPESRRWRPTKCRRHGALANLVNGRVLQNLKFTQAVR